MSTPVGTPGRRHYAALTMRALLAASLLGLVACLSTPAPSSGAEVVPGAAELPGEQHHDLAALAGDWQVTVTAPGEAEPLGAGWAQIESLHDGRFLRLTVHLVLGGQSMTLTGHLGHDRESGEWQALWLSDLSTGMSLLRGRGDLARGVNLVGVRGGVRGRSVLTVSGPNEFGVETHGPGPDGGERLLRRSDYVRR